MPALGSRHPEPQGGQSCGLPVIIQIRFCTRPGVRISQTITDYLGAYLVSLHAAILTALQTGSGAEALPVRCVYPGPFPLRDRILIFFSVFAFFLFPSLIGRLRSPMYRALFSVLLVNSPIFQISYQLWTNLKKIKKSSEFFETSHFSSFSSPCHLSLCSIYGRFSFL